MPPSGSGASRWSAVPATPASTGKAAKLTVVTSPGQPGETCVALVDAKHDAGNPLASRCTYGIVRPASAAANADGSALALAVQTGDTWREMWVFQEAGEWLVGRYPSARLDTPNLGYVEFAGWVPGGNEMLAPARSRWTDATAKVSEVLSLATLETRKAADRPASLSTFYRWQSPLWKAGTIAVRLTRGAAHAIIRME